MFGSRPTCPLDPPTKEWIDRRWQWLTEEFGSERLQSAPVILPTPEFFPDAYSGSDDDVRSMLDRVCGYMDIEPDTIELTIFQEGKSPYAEGMHHGAAGTYQEEDGKFHISIEAANIDEPQRLVATIAHELGHVHLLGYARIDPEVEDNEPLTDLLTVFFGMGVFTANSVIREKYWHAGEISGWSIGRQGYLTMPMYGYALAKFALARWEDRPPWAKHLRLDVRSPFNQSLGFLAAPPTDVPTGASVAPTLPETMRPESNKIEAQDAAPEPDDAEHREEAEPPHAPISAEELLERYAGGDRDFRNVDLPEASLREADLTGINLAGADLSETDLTSAILARGDLRGTYFQSAHLGGADLRRANLSEADLNGADLTGADLSGADIRGADFRGALLDGTNLVGTIRNRKTNFTDVDLSKVKCDVDLNKEDLKGKMLVDQMMSWPQLIAMRVIMLVFVGFVALFGGFVGAAIGLAMGDQNTRLVGAVIGAVIFGALFVRRLVRIRAQEKSERTNRA
jgi:hypothetical protein